MDHGLDRRRRTSVYPLCVDMDNIQNGLQLNYIFILWRSSCSFIAVKNIALLPLCSSRGFVVVLFNDGHPGRHLAVWLGNFEVVLDGDGHMTQLNDFDDECVLVFRKHLSVSSFLAVQLYGEFFLAQPIDACPVFR